ncbi:serologically defined colon cancer antigen 3 [Biomphalaria glabrata]|nr:putative serologically defined colon cancer antigen 3 [Biomphalaria glabrata]
MAERGVDEDNPFSFKAFVNVKDKKTAKSGNSLFYDTDDIFDANDKSLSNISSKKDNLADKPTTKTTNLNGATAPTLAADKKDLQKDNPFSFKKFLSSGSTKQKKSSEPTFLPKTKDILTASDDLFHEDIDFNQDVYSRSHHQHSRSPSEDLNRDFTKGNKNNPIPCDLLAESRLDSSLDEHLNITHDSQIPFLDEPAEGVLQTLPLHDKKQKLPLALPDFLSDGAAMKFPLDKKDIVQNEEELLERIKILQEEKEMLRKELAREKLMNNEKSQRLLQLSIDLEQQKKKEAEETAVLEKAVQQVEENLVTTTKRAVQAEANVSVLKKENKKLQSQLNSLLQMKESFKSEDKGLADIKERTKYTSEQLLSASVMAEKNIKELMAGVDKLKLLSQVLASIDKISDSSHDVSPEQDQKT